MTTPRKIIASRDGVALAEHLESDLPALKAAFDGAFDGDPGERSSLVPSVERAVVLDAATGELLGQVSWHVVGYGPTADAEAWNVGHMMLPAARGRGFGTIALRLLVEHLFATTPMHRIEAGTEVDNTAARRMLGKVGFLGEGILRGVILRGGVRRSYVMYSLLRDDLTAMDAQRIIVASRDGVTLATPLRGERDQLFSAAGSEFDLDPDERPRPFPPNPATVLVVLVGGEPVGSVSWHGVSYGGTLSSAAWNMGIGLLPEFRGRGYGTLAQRLLVEHLFDATELDRVEASTDVDNLAEQRSLEKAGFQREGILRGAQLRGGLRRDIVHYGFLRTDLQVP
jgi:RimJ/RimL family protein N-acetyltransferase